MNRNYLILILVVIILILIGIFVKLNFNNNAIAEQQKTFNSARQEIIPIVNTPIDKNILVDINNIDDSMLSVDLNNSKIVNLS